MSGPARLISGIPRWVVHSKLLEFILSKINRMVKKPKILKIFENMSHENKENRKK